MESILFCLWLHAPELGYRTVQVQRMLVAL